MGFNMKFEKKAAEPGYVRADAFIVTPALLYFRPGK